MESARRPRLFGFGALVFNVVGLVVFVVHIDAVLRSLAGGELSYVARKLRSSTAAFCRRVLDDSPTFLVSGVTTKFLDSNGMLSL